ncbi:MAG: hypothetical protein QQN41_11395, partial [Nitrosopumilus sp.]
SNAFKKEVFKEKLPCIMFTPLLYSTSIRQVKETMENYKNLSTGGKIGAVTRLSLEGVIGLAILTSFIFTVENYDLGWGSYLVAGAINIPNAIYENS